MATTARLPRDLLSMLTAAAGRRMAVTDGRLGWHLSDCLALTYQTTAFGVAGTDASERGGAITYTTGAGASSTSGQATTNVIYSGAASERFYVACRGKLTTSVSADTVAGVGFEASGFGTGTDYGLVGVKGASSTSVYYGIVGAQSAASTVAIDTGYHEFEMWCNGTTQQLSVDHETAVSFSAAGNPGSACYGKVGINNGAGGGVETFVVDWFFWAWERS